MNPLANAVINMMKHPVKFRMFLFSKLPAAWFSGLKLRELDGQHCVVSVPFSWYSKNPFRSTYFACLAMAAEMSTGALAMMQVYKRRPPVSMLVTRMEANYFKKAEGQSFFSCVDGQLLHDTVENAVASGEGHTIQVKSVGTNSKNEKIAEFIFTWSFKVKKSIAK